MRQLLHTRAMKLTQWTDYALRVLMYCAIHSDRDKLPTVQEIAQAHGISRSHLTKIVMTLAGLGWLETTRGRGGGLRLLKSPHELTVGDVVRHTETDMHMVECFNATSNTCRIHGHCQLKSALELATLKYMETLDGFTLAALTEPMRGHHAWVPMLPPVSGVPGETEAEAEAEAEADADADNAPDGGETRVPHPTA